MPHDMDRRSFLSTLAMAGAVAAMPAPVLAATKTADARVPSRPGRVRIGWVLSSEQFHIDELVKVGAAAENAGFDMVWTSDHFQPWQANEGHSSMAWCTLAALTQRTNHLHFGTGVTCPTYRYRPAVVAEAWASLAQLAPGRAFLAVGTGEALNEAASGAGWGPYAERAARLVEAVKIIRQLWSGHDVHFDGQYYKIDKARLYDPPPTHVPLYIAGNGPKSARLAGEHGDGWVTSLENVQNDAMRNGYLEGVRAAGKNPQQMEILFESWAIVGDQAEAAKYAELWRFTKKAWKPGYVTNPDPVDIQRRADSEIPLRDVYKDWPVSRDPAVHVHALEKMIDAGATMIFVHCPQPRQIELAHWYGRHVLPHVRRQARRTTLLGAPS
jgi:TAT-translocated FGD2 family F420-dependent dehydrogenase